MMMVVVGYLVHDALAPEVDAEDGGQLLHEDVGHLQGADDDLEVVRRKHARQVAGHRLRLEDGAQQVGRGVVEHAQERAQALVADGRPGRAAVHLVEQREQRTDELRRQLRLFLHNQSHTHRSVRLPSKDSFLPGLPYYQKTPSVGTAISNQQSLMHTISLSI